jgi:hypothetical protein
MKKLFLGIWTLFLAVGVLSAADKPPKNPLLASDTVVWAGLDFTLTKMIGPGAFNDPASIFPGMLEAWNNLFLAERLRFVEKETKKKVVTDIGGVTEANKGASTRQVQVNIGPEDSVETTHITREDIAKAVKNYKMEHKSGLGVVFIVDRFVKQDKRGKGAVYVVGFDIGTREVLFSQREVHNATGFGFRNYWFRVIKDSERALKNLR